jgi:inner membrane transporter RhtA
VPSIAELAGILCVIVAVALGGVERRARPAPPADTTRLQDPTREDGR